MIPWLLALLVVGIGPLVNVVLGVLRRDRERGSLVGGVREKKVLGEVAVVIAAHDAESEVAEALAAATRLVARGDVFLVSDASTDRTAEIGREHGVNVVETVSPLGRSGAVVAGLTGFRVPQDYRYVLVLDVDHRPHPAFLDRTLPIFDDPDVVAVAGFARTDWTTARRGPLGRLVTAHRGRAYALAQLLLTIIRTRPNAEAARVLPSPARMFRTSVLERVDLAPEGVPVADFDVSNQIYRAGLGRVVVVRGAVVGTRDPDTPRGYVRQARQWAVGFWQAVRRNGLRRGPQVLGLGWFAVESVLTSAVLLALPFLLGFGLLPVWTVLLGVFLPDLLLTALVALRQRQPGYLLPALFLPLMRLVDAVVLLSALPHAFRDRPATAPWLSPVRTAQPPPPVGPWWRSGPAAAVAWLVGVAAGVVLTLRVAAAVSTLPATASEPGLVDAVFGRVAGFGGAVPEGMVPAAAQLAGYASLTGAFDRHATVLTGVRELSVVCAAVFAAGLLVAAAVLRLRPVAVAVALAAVAVCPPAIGVLAGAGPGPIAAAWLAVAAVPLALAARVGWKAVPAAVIPVAGAVVTVPALVVPVAVAAAAWWVGDRERAREVRRVVVAVAVLVAGGALAALLAGLGLVGVSDAAPIAAAQRVWLLVAVAVVAVGGLVRGRARAGSAGLLAVAAGSAVLDSDVLLATAVAGAALGLAALLDGTATERSAVRRVAVGVAALAGLAVVGAGAAAVLPVAPAVDHRGAADWFTVAAAPGATLAAPPLLVSDLRRDLRGRAPQQVRPEGGYAHYTVSPADGAGLVVARFDGLTARLADGTAVHSGGPDRTAAGAQLADNPRIQSPEEVKAVLRAGALDFRAMAVLAEIGAQHDLVVADTSKPVAENGSDLPDRTVVLSSVDGRPAGDPAVVDTLRAWVQAQRGPYAPSDVRPTGDGRAALDWRIPNPGDPAPR
ncbi:glycosyltransferase [Actinokineospora spheciospongiae]|uniref:glycosyltransferase n=1 Tax=Actinokineospora spheciospongiae TaxID=909613 RepID=UPI000D85DEB5|nr:glycosyltransferase family 2 protein [Actinokineospora spheciospongiae]PWW54264.1 cellulose synthase/poly-beta-1,6-N-acetylglucosamine synthase-like glycosyltransferase [Actinokineospora spheciospongiae]